MGELEGRTAVVLGSSSPGGIGEAIARAFAEAGAKVVVAGRRLEQCETLAEELGGVACACDITEEADISRLAETAAGISGAVHIALNAAGANINGPIAETTAEQLRQSSDLHFVGPVLFIKHMAAKMSGGGSIVNVSSLTAFTPGAGLTPYAGAKAGADYALRIAALEYAPLGIRVNAIAPGLVETPFTRDMFAVPTIKAAFEKETPLGRTATVEDVAAVALWLAGDRYFDTGQVIQVSGGATHRRLPTWDEMMPEA